MILFYQGIQKFKLKRNLEQETTFFVINRQIVNLIY